MKRILFLTPQLPYPLHQGTTLRNYGLISGLAERGHQVGLFSFVEAGQPAIEDTPLAALCQPAMTIGAPQRTITERIRDLAAGYADMARRRWSSAFAAALADLLISKSFDVIHIEGIEMAPYLKLIKDKAPDAMLIYDAHNAEYALQQRIASTDRGNPRRWHAAVYSMIQTARLTQLETETCRTVDHVIAVSETDAGLLRKLPHSTPVTVIPNAILADTYRREDWADTPIPHPSMVFTGKMDFRPNIDAALWFADDILPLITAQIADAHFVIVGQKPHARLDTLRNNPNVTLTGYVDDIRPYLKAADVYIAPLRMGSGTRFKLLEAMAMQAAVISTRIGAEGLSVQEGEHALLADDPQLFADAVIGLLRDPSRRAAMGEAARQLVCDQYDWRAIIPQVEAIYC